MPSDDYVILLDEKVAVELILERMEDIRQARRDCAKAFAYLRSIDSTHLKNAPLLKAKCELDGMPSDPHCAASFHENCFSLWLYLQKLTRISNVCKNWGGFIFENGERRFIDQMFPDYPPEIREAMYQDIEKRVDELNSQLTDSDLFDIEP